MTKDIFEDLFRSIIKADNEAFKKLDCDFGIKLNKNSLYMIIGNW